MAELASNAVHHAGTPFVVIVDLEPDRVRVEVADEGPGRPVYLDAGADATSGRGLPVVAALSSGWGWQRTERDGVSGKVVWAEVPLSVGPV